MSLIGALTHFFRVWRTRRDGFRQHYNVKGQFEIRTWAKYGRVSVARDKKGRLLSWHKAPELVVIVPDEMFRSTVAVRCVVRGEYFSVVAHYYGLTWIDAKLAIPALMKAVLKRAYEVSHYHHSQVEDFRIGDIMSVAYEPDMIGVIELEEEWEL